jgi:hypothetical protein
VGQVGIFSLNARNITFQCIVMICLNPKQEIIRSHKDHKFDVRGLIFAYRNFIRRTFRKRDAISLFIFIVRHH